MDFLVLDNEIDTLNLINTIDYTVFVRRLHITGFKYQLQVEVVKGTKIAFHHDKMY